MDLVIEVFCLPSKFMINSMQLTNTNYLLKFLCFILGIQVEICSKIYFEYKIGNFILAPTWPGLTKSVLLLCQRGSDKCARRHCTGT